MHVYTVIAVHSQESMRLHIFLVEVPRSVHAVLITSFVFEPAISG